MIDVNYLIQILELFGFDIIPLGLLALVARNEFMALSQYCEASMKALSFFAVISRAPGIWMKTPFSFPL